MATERWQQQVRRVPEAKACSVASSQVGAWGTALDNEVEAGLFLGLHWSFRPQRQGAARPGGLRSRGGAGRWHWRDLAQTPAAPRRQGKDLRPWLEDPKGCCLDKE